MTVWTWQEAMDLCDQLVYANRTDWRLPTMVELNSFLVEAYFVGLPPPLDWVQEQSWWVKTLMPGDTQVSYSLQNKDLNEYNRNKVSGDYVLPVRAGNFDAKGKLLIATYVEPRFELITTMLNQYNQPVATIDYTVRDKKTGLIWVMPGSWWEGQIDNYKGETMDGSVA